MKRRLSADPWLLILVLLASVIGILAIWDAGYAQAAKHGKLIPEEVYKQGIFFLVSLGIALFAARLNPAKWRVLSWVLLSLSIIGLALVYVPGLGREINGSRRWIGVGPLTIQPAEIVKVAAIVFLARAYASYKALRLPRLPRNWAETLDMIWVPRLRRAMPLFAVLGLAVVIERQPDLGTAAVIVALGLVMVAVAGVAMRKILLLVLLMGAVVGVMVIAEPYRMARITNHADRWSPQNINDAGFQTTHSELALARGGLFGQGLGNGRAKYALPTPTTDYILTTIGEELGFVGVLVLLLLMAGIIYRLLALAGRQTDGFARLYLVGFSTWIAVQTIANVMMVNGFLPPIGIPFPFISYGGSSLIALWLGVGIAMSVIQPSPEPAEKREEVASESRRIRRGYGRAYLSRS